MIYAGDHGGCMLCDSTAAELRDRGHRPRCRSEYRSEPPWPPAKRARWRREEAKRLRDRADQLEAEAAALEDGGEVAGLGL